MEEHGLASIFNNRPKSDTQLKYEEKIAELNDLLLAEQILDIDKEILATRKRLAIAEIKTTKVINIGISK